jgi:polysaccharide pyruvyl transferase WcaK-like protein
MSVVLSADLAFLYPYGAAGRRTGSASPYRVVFLRSNNLNAAALRVEDGALYEGSRLIVPAGDRLVLATSDRQRDERFLARTAARLGLPGVVCRSVPELVDLVAGSSGVISDRYHPAICAAALGKPTNVLANREPHKMEGLQALLAGKTIGELQALARAGLRSVCGALGRAS